MALMTSNHPLSCRLAVLNPICTRVMKQRNIWIPAFAGMTDKWRLHGNG